MLTYKKIIDISQPISEHSAVFPGDVPFQRELTLKFEENNVINLSSFKMSPHVGTHIDAPAHIKGSMTEKKNLVASLPLEAFIGEVLVLDIAPKIDSITFADIAEKLFDYDGPPRSNNTETAHTYLPQRILFRTQEKIRYNIFEKNYAFFSVNLIEELSRRGVILLGIDTPSVDHQDSKTLDAHHCLNKQEMFWLENLDLTEVNEGHYFLIAFPLRFEELEASPVRAVLLEI